MTYPGTLLHGKPRFTAKARVTAGLMWAALMPPATYTPKVTANAQPQAMRSQSPLASKISSPRLDWLRAATAIATTPSPNAIRTKVPKNSAESSPQTVERQPFFGDDCADTVIPPFISSSDASSAAKELTYLEARDVASVVGDSAGILNVFITEPGSSYQSLEV